MNKEYSASWDEPVNVHQDSVHSNEAGVSRHAAAVKQIVTIRLDVDMLEWFKGQGPRYQTRMNQVLRDHMEAQLVKAGSSN